MKKIYTYVQFIHIANLRLSTITGLFKNITSLSFINHQIFSCDWFIFFQSWPTEWPLSHRMTMYVLVTLYIHTQTLPINKAVFLWSTLACNHSQSFKLMLISSTDVGSCLSSRIIQVAVLFWIILFHSTTKQSKKILTVLPSWHVVFDAGRVDFFYTCYALFLSFIIP